MKPNFSIILYLLAYGTLPFVVLFNPTSTNICILLATITIVELINWKYECSKIYYREWYKELLKDGNEIKDKLK